MSLRVLILVEGQTEERFVKDVLGPAFWNRHIYFVPTLLVTKHVKDGPNFKGGVTNYAKFQNDVRRLLKSSGGALVTTLLDYYKLPTDFPGMDSRATTGRPIDRVLHVEQAIMEDFGSPSNFFPFLVLHEFETFLFCSLTELPKSLFELHKQGVFAAIRNGVKTPEEINERPTHAPSKQIENLFPAYKKTLHGPLVAQRIGLENIRAECPHFNDWLSKIETYAAAKS